MDYTKVLTRQEVFDVLADLERRALRSVNSWENLALFRLSCCCGLRCKEICGLNVGDLTVTGARPVVRIRKEITKGQQGKRRARNVPLWWDSGTLVNLGSWMDHRIRQMNAGQDDPFLCSLHSGLVGQRLAKEAVSHRWRTAIRGLGPERVKQLPTHSGRHSFCTHALMVGRSLMEVRDAAGHANITVTSIYLHNLESTNVPDMFKKEE